MTNSMQQSPDSIERKAINPSGRVGSFYDGCRDQVIERPNTSFPEQCLPSLEPPQCYLISGDNDKSKNILRIIGIQDELRLSLLLLLTKRDGIAAVLNYSERTDKHTRFLYYSRMTRELNLQKKAEQNKIGGIWHPHTTATHVITSINIGIDIVVVLQLPSTASINNKIDSTLEKICSVLLGDENNMKKLSRDDNEVLEHILHTKIYSNILSLTHLSKVSDLFRQINILSTNPTRCSPLSYTLQTVASLYSAGSIKAAIYKPLSTCHKHALEQQVVQHRNMLKHSEVSLKDNGPKGRNRHSEQLLDQARVRFQLVKEKFMATTKRFSKLVIDARSKRINDSEISQALCPDEQIRLRNDITELTRSLPYLEIEGHSIIDLQQQELKYRTTTKYNSDEVKRRKPSEPELITTHRQDRDYCSMDTSKKNKLQKSQSSSPDLTSKSKCNSNSYLGNSDFLFSDSERPNIMASPSTRTNNEYSQSRSLPSTHRNVTIASLPSETSETINILLLGETGVGKSTFINAFANYLTFDSLEQAQNNEPTVIIPVSFIMAIGDNFEEQGD